MSVAQSRNPELPPRKHQRESFFPPLPASEKKVSSLDDVARTGVVQVACYPPLFSGHIGFHDPNRLSTVVLTKNLGCHVVVYVADDMYRSKSVGKRKVKKKRVWYYLHVVKYAPFLSDP